MMQPLEGLHSGGMGSVLVANRMEVSSVCQESLGSRSSEQLVATLAEMLKALGLGNCEELAQVLGTEAVHFAKTLV